MDQGSLFSVGHLRTMMVAVVFLGMTMFIITYQIADHRYAGLLMRRGTGKADWSSESPVNITWVKGEGPLERRLSTYNAKINSLRSFVLASRKGSWWKGTRTPTSAIYGIQPDFLHQVGALTNVWIIGLQWKNSTGSSRIKGVVRADPANLVINGYYDWVVDEELCKFLKNPGKPYPLWTYWPTCTTKFDATLFPKPVDSRFVNIRWWSSSRVTPKLVPFSQYSSEPEFVTYIIIAQNAAVTAEGSLVTGDVQIIPFTCKTSLVNTAPTNIESAAMFEEVFVVSQMWFYKYYHKSIEMYPRLIPYLQFLIKNPRIRIHAGTAKDHDKEWLKMFEIPKYRIVKGTVRANIVYMPEVTYCGFANPANTQLLSKMYRDQIRHSHPETKQDTLILIKRSRIRGIKQHRLLEIILQTICRKYHWNFWVFSDDPVPPLSETMYRFNRALMVVAPHGAGLSNIIFSEPGIFVVEILCNIPDVNMCYERLSYVLGHHYYGTAARRGCPTELDIDVVALQEVLEFYSRHAAKLSSAGTRSKFNIGKVNIINA